MHLKLGALEIQFIELLFCNAAMLACVIVAFQSRYALVFPTSTAPTLHTAEPVRSILAAHVFRVPFAIALGIAKYALFTLYFGWCFVEHVAAVGTWNRNTLPSGIICTGALCHPICIAFSGTKTGAFYFRRFHVIGLPALLALDSALILGAFFAAILTAVFVRFLDLIFFAATLARKDNAVLFFRLWPTDGRTFYALKFHGKMIGKALSATKTLTGITLTSNRPAALLTYHIAEIGYLNCFSALSGTETANLTGLVVKHFAANFASGLHKRKPPCYAVDWSFA